MKQQKHVDVVDLLASVLRGSPALPGARCRGRADLFDGDGDEQITQAVELCRRCAVLDRCAAWADQQPRGALHGVYAGRVHTWVQPAPSRPRKAAS